MNAITLAVTLILLSHHASSFSTTSLQKSRNTLQSLHETKSNNDNLNRRNIVKKSLSFTGGVLSTIFLTSSANARDAYLTEPTDEFKQSEEARAKFKQEQFALKKSFSTVLTRLTTESDTEQALVKDLNELIALVIKTGGLPIGLKKEEMYKMIRTKKRAGPWPTPVEIAYQNLVREVIYQQSPNTEKDTMSPL